MLFDVSIANMPDVIFITYVMHMRNMRKMLNERYAYGIFQVVVLE